MAPSLSNKRSTSNSSYWLSLYVHTYMSDHFIIGHPVGRGGSVATIGKEVAIPLHRPYHCENPRISRAKGESSLAAASSSTVLSNG